MAWGVAEIVEPIGKSDGHDRRAREYARRPETVAASAYLGSLQRMSSWPSSPRASCTGWDGGHFWDWPSPPRAPLFGQPHNEMRWLLAPATSRVINGLPT